MNDNAATKKSNKKRIALAAIAIIATLVIAITLLAASCSSSLPEEESHVSSAAAESQDVGNGEEPEEPILADETSAEFDEHQETPSVPVLNEANKDSAYASVQSSAGESHFGTQPSSETPVASVPQKRWVEDTEQVWVEDKAAWSEQVPVYGNKEVSICNICGADVTGNASAHGKAHMLAGEGSGHHSEARQTITGYETVSYPAEGHYETRVMGGHWE